MVSGPAGSHGTSSRSTLLKTGWFHQGRSSPKHSSTSVARERWRSERLFVICRGPASAQFWLFGPVLRFLRALSGQLSGVFKGFPHMLAGFSSGAGAGSRHFPSRSRTHPMLGRRGPAVGRAVWAHVPAVALFSCKGAVRQPSFARLGRGGGWTRLWGRLGCRLGAGLIPELGLKGSGCSGGPRCPVPISPRRYCLWHIRDSRAVFWGATRFNF
jgi:hypothetical protein